jgi:DNA-binding transcriptional LysR family regulator
MTLQQLKYVLAVSQSGSFREASKKLYMSQPAISNLIRDLEEELGIKIFERTGKGVVITQDGRRLIEHAQRMVECEEEIFSAFNRKTGDNQFSFMVSSQRFVFVERAFLQIIRRFGSERYWVRLRETTTANILRDVSTRKSEIGFFALNHPVEKQLRQVIGDSDLAFHKLYTGKTYVFLNKRHPLSNQKQLTLEALAPYPCITYDQEEEPLHLFSEEPVIPASKPAKTIVVSDLNMSGYACRELDAYDLGTGWFLPDVRSDVVSIPLEKGKPYDFGYVALQNAEMSEAAEYMVDMVKKYFWAYFCED